MKIKFKITSGNITGYQAFKDDYEFFSVDSDEIYSSDFDESHIEYFKAGHLIFENAAIRKMSPQEIDEYEAEKLAAIVLPYNDKACKAELARTFGIAFSMATFYPALSDYLTYRNWAELNDFYLPGLLSASPAYVTAEQALQFATIVNKWGGNIVLQ